MNLIILVFFFFSFLIGKQWKYIKSASKMCTKYTWSIQVATEYKQKERETTNQLPKQYLEQKISS